MLDLSDPEGHPLYNDMHVLQVIITVLGEYIDESNDKVVGCRKQIDANRQRARDLEMELRVKKAKSKELEDKFRAKHEAYTACKDTPEGERMKKPLQDLLCRARAKKEEVNALLVSGKTDLEKLKVDTDHAFKMMYRYEGEVKGYLKTHHIMQHSRNVLLQEYRTLFPPEKKRKRADLE